MEALNTSAANNLGALLIALAVVCVVLAGLLFKYIGKINALQKKYDFFTNGKETNIDTVLTDALTELRQTKAELDALQEKHDRLRQQVKGCLQQIKIERQHQKLSFHPKH